ncbi:MAG: UUP1 family membrane protein [Proteobacteria bacterium]|nr:UUP1 family membrane protein [Pseudomonadota bacterium]
MQRLVAVTGACLIAFGLGVFAWKTLRLDLPVRPGESVGLWHVELEVTARGSGEYGSVRLGLPETGAGQQIFDARSISDRVELRVRRQEHGRSAVWSGRFDGVHQLGQRFRVQLSGIEYALPTRPTAPPPPELAGRHAAPSPEYPSDDASLASLLESVPLPGLSDPVARLRTLFTFVTEEIATVPTGSDDAVLTLLAREGSAVGKTRLLVALARAAGIPARGVVGLRLRAGVAPEELVWCEVWVDGNWIPAAPALGVLAERPVGWLALQRGSLELVEASGVDAVNFRFVALRETLRPEELAAMMVPPNPLLERISLYRLPVSTQSMLRAILLFPLGALLIAFLRNLVGIPTFGTFMPLLIALALRNTSLVTGLVMVSGVLAIGILGRLFLDRLRLLLVPRLSILLCVVVLVVTLLALFGLGFGSRDLYSGLLFPLVILTMLIERFSITLDEEGLREALARALWSTLAAAAVYPLFQSPLAEHLMFGFPELIFAIMGLLVLTGGYTGYRVSELIRFRSLVREAREA